MGRDAKTPARVLVADDDDDIRDLIKSFVRDEGFQVAEATNGRQALEAARREHFDLFILDLDMPEQDGFTTARLIREDVDRRPVPIIFITGHGEMGIELFQNINALGEGPLEYIPKPNVLEHLGLLLASYFPEARRRGAR